ncbi:hypothetical protein D3C71_1746170 [compost metagenome]
MARPTVPFTLGVHVVCGESSSTHWSAGSVVLGNWAVISAVTLVDDPTAVTIAMPVS